MFEERRRLTNDGQIKLGDIGRESITGPHRDKRDKQPSTLTLTQGQFSATIYFFISSAKKKK